MKTVKSVADLRRVALASGATVELPDGQRFNAAGAQLKGLAPVPPAPAAPAERAAAAPAAPAPLPDMVSRSDVERLMAQHSVRMHELFSKMLSATRSAALPASQQPRQWDFSIEYGRSGEILHVTARATP